MVFHYHYETAEICFLQVDYIDIRLDEDLLVSRCINQKEEEQKQGEEGTARWL